MRLLELRTVPDFVPIHINPAHLASAEAHGEHHTCITLKDSQEAFVVTVPVQEVLRQVEMHTTITTEGVQA